MPPLELRQRGIIGDRSTAALVAADGSIDWYCPARFDAPAALFALLDPDGGTVGFGLSAERSGGALRAPRPAGPTAQQGPLRPQRYGIGHEPVLTTELHSPDGLVEVSDHFRDGRIVRIATVRRGPVDLTLRVVPGWRFDRPRKVDRWSRGVAFGELAVAGLPADEPVRLELGEQAVVTVGSPLDSPLTVSAALDHQRRVAEQWRPSFAEIPYDGPYRHAVLCAVRTIRLLTDATTGAIVNSATTSVPARIGNERTTDGRLGWLRENAAIVWLWERLGMHDWADETRSWLSDRASDELPLAPVYRANGERPPTEIELPLAGYQGSGAVRVSTRAGDGVDLGGTAALALVLDARRSWKDLCRLGGWMATAWPRPDAGRWDSRARPAQWVASKLAVHRSLIALVRTARSIDPLSDEVLAWSDSAEQLGRWLHREGRFGVAPMAGWRRAPEDDSCDAATFPWAFAADPPALAQDVDRGPENEAHTRMKVTLDQALAQLTEWPFLHRHLPHVDDGFPPGQGPDLVCSFHAVSALCRVGRWEEAHDRMAALVAFVGPLGLVPSHADLDTGDFRGNLPSSMASAALITAALDLSAGPR